MDEADQKRRLRVWTQDLTLHATGRNEDGTEVPEICGPIAWAPNGSLIATSEVR